MFCAEVAQCWLMCVLDHVPLRLSGGKGRCSGRLEVYHNAVWGSVCDDQWDISDAQVVCRQLGCGAALRADGNSVFGAGEGVVWMNRVECRGNEIHLWDCPLSLKNHTDCSHKEHAGLTCAGHSQYTEEYLVFFFILLCVKYNHDYECVCVCFDRFVSVHYSCHNNISFSSSFSFSALNISLSSTNSSSSVSLRPPSACDCTGSCALTDLSATAYTDSAEQSDEER